ncbi:MAG: hypothetical protein F8N37_05095 [Telmatospirillum sp.]|nr:hypothetical protein [Telmatospirillum sp.]
MTGASLAGLSIADPGPLPKGVFDIVLFATDGDWNEGQTTPLPPTGDRIGARVILRTRGAGMVGLAFLESPYPLSKLIIRFLAIRQGIEPYHPLIGL